MGKTVEKMVPNWHIVDHKLVHLHFDEMMFLLNGSKNKSIDEEDSKTNLYLQ